MEQRRKGFNNLFKFNSSFSGYSLNDIEKTLENKNKFEVGIRNNIVYMLMKRIW